MYRIVRKRTDRRIRSGYLEVDDRLRVLSVAGGWLYAAGDVNGRALLTHQGKYQDRRVIVGASFVGPAPRPVAAATTKKPR